MSAQVLCFPAMPLPIDHPLPNRLRFWRKARSMTLDEAAPAIGISRVHLQRLETGGRELTMPVMERAAKFYHVLPADLLNVEHGGLQAGERELVETVRDIPESGRRAVAAVAESHLAWRDQDNGGNVLPLTEKTGTRRR